MKTIITALSVVALLAVAPSASFAAGGGVGGDHQVAAQVDGR